MDELIRRKLFKPYRKLNKQSYGSQQSSEVNFDRLFILHEGKSPTLAYFESAIISRFPDAEYHFIDTLASTDLFIPRGSALVVIRFISPKWQQHIERYNDRFSRIVYFMD